MIIKIDNLSEIREKHTEKIIFLRGSFDLLHEGHILYLKQAKAFGDILVVAIARDEDLKIRKGKGRPILPFAQRVAVMDAIKYVDYVVELPLSGTSEQNKNATFKILQQLHPDVFITPYEIWKKSAKK